jgi:hypothetical protein
MSKREFIAIFLVVGFSEKNFLFALLIIEVFYIAFKLAVRPYRRRVFWFKLAGDILYLLAIILLIIFQMTIFKNPCEKYPEAIGLIIFIMIVLFIIFYLISFLLSLLHFPKKQT